MRTILLFIVMAGLLHACKTKEKIKYEDLDQSWQDDTPGEHSILTLILEFTLDTTGLNDKVELTQKIFSKGTLKKESHSFDTSHPYQLAFYDAELYEIDRISFADPLRKRAEHSTEDGQILMSDITLDQDAVAIRMNYSQELTKLNLYKKSDTQLVLVNSFKI